MKQKNVVLAAVGGVMVLAISAIGVANADGNQGNAIDSRDEAIARLEHAEADIKAVKEYLKRKPTPPPTTTTVPPSSTTSVTPPSSTSVSPSPSTTVTSPPVPVGDTAAAKFNWGTPVRGDEFSVGTRPGSQWAMYNGPGHDGNGRRVPSAFSITGGVLTVTGSPNGDSGGMAYQTGQKFGKWETRMKVDRGDRDYHPVLLLWPDAEDWPVGGEVDYAEMESTSADVDFFLHYGRDNQQTHASKVVDITQWHNYAVSWDANCIKGYIDGLEFFSDCNKSHLPPRAMHPTIQLDAFGGDSGYITTKMHVDYIRIWN